ncbi:MAG: PKD domain-containing protein [Pseudomonadota bacterium]|nr:PKD domain-containing protein [Pseudomonadota bacterium]
MLSVSGYAWSFADGSTSTAPSTAYTYTNAGTYTVSLTATGPGGTNTKTQNSYITVSSSSGGGGGNNDGLVGAYNFEEASGTTVVDASGKGNTGTISGATPRGSDGGGAQPRDRTSQQLARTRSLRNAPRQDDDDAVDVGPHLIQQLSIVYGQDTSTQSRKPLTERYP